MRSELYIKAETREEEEFLKVFSTIHFQTYIQDEIESRVDDWSFNNSIVKLPEIVFIGMDGKILQEVRQGFNDGGIVPRS